MRKHHQQQITEMLRTLGEAHDEMKKPGVSGQVETILRLLTDCQNAAVHIGNFIEEQQGEGTRTVALLEEYCELLYRIGVAASDGDGKGAANQIKRLQKQIALTENSVRDELAPNRIEAVFLPYKASMWDSMESVWLAAQDDPVCDAYVIPIPYYDKLPNGALGQMHYEGGDYPASVPVVDYRTYNIEERRPDLVVIHSPYDGGNLVTGVHPDFYSERLKAFTDLLVYIPYFVVLGDVPEPFCVCAGTLYADRVIVQSEEIRRTYMRVFKEFEKKNNCKGRFGKPEIKFLALGSPKFDKTLRTKREDCELPRAWRRLTERPDGTRKKVVLYNTSIGALLESGEKMLVKLREVFALFRERDVAVLWWRPHPLNEATYKAMRPQLLREYESIVADYRRAGFGVYDDTPDLHRAIAASDAYYGDGSSLVAMYLVTGKPIMIQDANILPENRRGDAFFFESCHDDGAHIWFCAYWFNALFKCDKETWTAEYIGSFPGERSDGVRLFSDVAACGDKLYFAPMTADAAAVYDMKKNAFGRIDLAPVDAEKYPDYSPYAKFGQIVSAGGGLFLIPGFYPAIVRIDARTNAVSYITDWAPRIEKIKNDLFWYFYGVAAVGEKLYISACCASAVAVLDTERLTCEVFSLGKSKAGYNGICCDGENLWLAPRRTVNGAAVLVKSRVSDPAKPAIEPAVEYVELQAPADCAYLAGKPDGLVQKMIFSNGRLCVLPLYMDRAFAIDTGDGGVSDLPAFRAECEIDAPPVLFDKYSGAWQSGDAIYALGCRSRRLTVYDTASGAVRSVAIAAGLSRIPIRALMKDAGGCVSPGDFIYAENEIVGAEEFVTIVTNPVDAECCGKQAELSREANGVATQSAGDAIYAHCRDLALGAGGF
jgi:hypothetical protein